MPVPNHLFSLLYKSRNVVSSIVGAVKALYFPFPFAFTCCGRPLRTRNCSPRRWTILFSWWTTFLAWIPTIHLMKWMSSGFSIYRKSPVQVERSKHQWWRWLQQSILTSWSLFRLLPQQCGEYSNNWDDMVWLFDIEECASATTLFCTPNLSQ